MNKELLLQYLRNTCTLEETQEVERWILASKKNTKYFNKIKTDFVIGTFDETTREISIDKTFDDFESKHLPKRLSFSKRYARNLSYAAFFLILITSSYLIFLNIAGEENIGIVENTIAIPDDAISLQLEDGSVKIIEEDGSSKILDKSGNLVIQQRGSQLVYSSQEESALEELVYNRLTVPYGKKFELLLSDGTTVYLNSGSSLKYPVKFIKGNHREVFITGEAYFDVAKDSARPFITKANNLNVEVLGTEFNISAYPEDKTTEVVLVEGSVSLSAETEESNTENTLLQPGFKASLNKDRNSINKEKVVTNVYTSWMKDELVFRKMSFENILKKLERYYDVVIINKNEALSKKIFNANFGSEPLEKVLEELKENYGIIYMIAKDGTIIIE